MFDEDPAIFVRLDGTMDKGYTVTPVTGVNRRGEEFVTRPLSGLSRDDAFDVAATLVYAINGTAGRVQGNAEFTGE